MSSQAVGFDVLLLVGTPTDLALHDAYQHAASNFCTALSSEIVEEDKTDDYIQALAKEITQQAAQP